MRRKSAKMPEVIFSLAPYDRLVKFQVQIEEALVRYACWDEGPNWFHPRSDASQLYRIICHVLTYNSKEFVFGNFFPKVGVLVLYCMYWKRKYLPMIPCTPGHSFRKQLAPILSPFVTQNLFRKKNFSSFLFLLPPTSPDCFLSVSFSETREREPRSIQIGHRLHPPAPFPSQSKHCIKKLES